MTCSTESPAPWDPHARVEVLPHFALHLDAYRSVALDNNCSDLFTVVYVWHYPMQTLAKLSYLAQRFGESRNYLTKVISVHAVVFADVHHVQRQSKPGGVYPFQINNLLVWSPLLRQRSAVWLAPTWSLTVYKGARHWFTSTSNVLRAAVAWVCHIKLWQVGRRTAWFRRKHILCQSQVHYKSNYLHFPYRSYLGNNSGIWLWIFLESADKSNHAASPWSYTTTVSTLTYLTLSDVL